MGTVSSTVCAWLADVLAAADLPEETWLAGLDVDPATLRGSDRQLDWSLFVELCRRFEDQFADRAALLAATGRCARDRFENDAAELPGRFNDPRQLYWTAHHWIRPTAFPAFGSDYQELPDGRVQVSLESPAADPALPVLFEMVQSVLAHLPRLIGHAPARIEAAFTERRAIYTIAPAFPQVDDIQLRRTLDQRITAHASDVIVQLDEAGVLTYVSPNIEALLGFEPADIIGRSASEFLRAGDSSLSWRLITEHMQTRGFGGMHLRTHHRDGSTRWLDLSTREAPSSHQPARFVVVVRDVTEQRRAMRESEDWRDRYEAIIHASGRLVYDWDVSSGTIEFRGKGEHLGFGFDRGGANLWDHLVDVSPADRVRFREELRRAMEAKSSYHIEYAVRPNDPDEIFIENDGYLLLDGEGEVRRIIGFVCDVTAHKRGERALKEQRDLLDRVAAASPEIFYVFDVERWRLTYVNDAVEAAIGISSEELVNRRPTIFREILHPEDLAALDSFPRPPQ